MEVEAEVVLVVHLLSSSTVQRRENAKTKEKKIINFKNKN
jgi:hypothetical protein